MQSQKTDLLESEIKKDETEIVLSKKQTAKRRAAIFFFGFVALLSALLCLIAFLLPADLMTPLLADYFETLRTPSDTMHILLFFLGLLPLTLFGTAIALSKKPKEVIKAEAPSPTMAKSVPAPSFDGNSYTSAPSLPLNKGSSNVPSSQAGVESGPRFKMLTAMDAAAANIPVPPYDNSLTLSDLCKRFRNFAAMRLKLYYDEADVRKFIASLGVSPIVILQGMSGTGKTSLACAFGKFVHHDAAVVPVQPMWKERSDMLGYFNEFTERFNETGFLCTLYAAHYSEDVCLTVLDEMNIARVEYYFADFLSLLELPRAKDRLLTVTSESKQGDPRHLHNGRICIPENMWYVGTANNDDSTFAISDKVYDRAMIINLEHKAHPFTAEENEGVFLSFSHFRALVTEACETYALSATQRENLATLDKYMIDTLHVTFGNRIMKQLERYVPLCIACGGTEEEALDDMISQKLFRKLDALNPVLVKRAAPGLLQTLHDLFGEENMPACRAYVRRLNENL